MRMGSYRAAREPDWFWVLLDGSHLQQTHKPQIVVMLDLISSLEFAADFLVHEMCLNEDAEWILRQKQVLVRAKGCGCDPRGTRTAAFILYLKMIHVLASAPELVF